jgi:hypothetical protein
MPPVSATTKNSVDPESVWLPSGLEGSNTGKPTHQHDSVEQSGSERPVAPWVKSAEASRPASPPPPQDSLKAAAQPDISKLPNPARTPPAAAGPSTQQTANRPSAPEQWLPTTLQQDQSQLTNQAQSRSADSRAPAEIGRESTEMARAQSRTGRRATNASRWESEAMLPTPSDTASSQSADELAPGSASETEPDQWLPPALRHEQNPLASGAWLAEEASLPTVEGSPQASTGAPTVSSGSSWLPPELAAEGDATSPLGPSTEARGDVPDAGPKRPTPPQAQAAAFSEPSTPLAQEHAVVETSADERTAPQETVTPNVATANTADTGSKRGHHLLGGDPAALGRRRRAVEAYCRELFTHESATGITLEILNSLTGGIQDAELLEKTRAATAKHAGHMGSPMTGCPETGALLAARLDPSLSNAERTSLENHLASCLVCQTAQVRTARAERAFTGILGPMAGTREV